LIYGVIASGLSATQDKRFENNPEDVMSDRVYKKVELVGTSSVSSDDAIQQAIQRASKTLKHLDWFEVMETRGHIVDGKVAHYQVTLKVGFRLED
jgi:dodecin